MLQLPGGPPCRRCRLGTLPRQLSALANLRVCYLHDCFGQFGGEGPSEAEFAAALGPLHTLGMLSLSSCNLSRVPAVVVAMTSLRVSCSRDSLPLTGLLPGNRSPATCGLCGGAVQRTA